MTLQVRKYDLGSMRDHDLLREALRGLHYHAAALDPLKRLQMQPGYVDHEVTETLRVVRAHRGAIFVAEADGVFAGLVIGFTNSQTDTDKLSVVESQMGIISDLFVGATFRGNGVGTALLERIEGYLHGLGCDAFWLSTNAFNTDACEFYERRGYMARDVAFTKQA